MGKSYLSISDAFKNVNNAIKLAQKRALTKSATSTRVLIRKDIRAVTGLKSDYINRRIKLNRPASGTKNKYSFRAGVGIATKAMIPMRLFKPKTKKVRTKAGPRKGVTVKIGKGSRNLIPNAFIMSLKGTDIVAARKGKERKPTKQLFSTVWVESIMGQIKTYKKYIVDRYKTIVKHEMKYALSKRDNDKE